MTLKCVVLSDTHGTHQQVTVPDGDVLIHCGDFCKYGQMDEIRNFVEWLTEQSHKHIIVVAGNHDKPVAEQTSKVRALFESKNINLLLNEEVVIDGVKFWGSPVTPTFFNWHFMRDRGKQIAEVWKQIPGDVDVLITHGPPYGHGDLCPPYRTSHRKVAGCMDLLIKIHEVYMKSGGQNPKVHCFGHIHDGHGITQSDQFGGLVFINAATCNENYQPVNPMIAFEVTAK